MARLFLALFFLLGMISQGFTEEEFNSEIPQSTDNPVNFPAAQTTNNDVLNRTLFNYRQSAYLLYNNATSLTIGPGEVACNSNTGAVNGQTIIYRRTTANITGTIANLDTGSSFAANTTYYVYASCDVAATTFTVVISLNGTSPSGVTNYRLLGNFTMDNASNIASIVNNNLIGFGTPNTSITTGTPYLATTDGDVVVSADGSGPTNWFVQILADANPTPTTLRERCGIPTSAGAHCALSYGVKAGYYYEIVSSGSPLINNIEFDSRQ